MSQNIVKVLDKGFSDMSAGQRMLISSPEKISEYITSIPKGSSRTVKQMRLELAMEVGADNTCPLTTGIFLRKAIEDNPSAKFPYWRVIDSNHPLVKKLNLTKSEIERLRSEEGITNQDKTY